MRLHALADEAHGSAVRVSELVGAMAAYTFLDQAPVVDVDVNASLESTLAVLGHRLAGVAVRLELSPGAPARPGYGSELTQVWTALIDNAILALDGRGELRIRSRCEADMVYVEVADDGPGVPEDIQGRIFEQFFTTRPVGAGVGLGLDVSHRIVVSHHHGNLGVRSRPGETRFEGRLPTRRP